MKAELNARVKITAGPASGLFGTIAHVDESTWRADIALDDRRMARNVPLKHVEVIPAEPITDRVKLLDRIRKIWAKAESLKSMGPDYEGEALEAAAQAQKMLAKYKLSLDDLQMAQLERDEPVGESHASAASDEKYGEWVEALARVVARAHFCRITTFRNWYYIVGRETDRKITEFIVGVLHRSALEMSDKAARKFRKEQRRREGRTTSENRNFRTAWLVGFVERIAERYREEERVMEREQQMSGGRSLVLVSKNALKAVDAFISEQQAEAEREREERARSYAAWAKAHPKEAAAAEREVERATRKAERAWSRRSGDDERETPGAGAHRSGRAAGRAAADTVNIRGTGLGASAPRRQLGDN